MIMEENKIKDFCKRHRIKNYTINPDGSIDVNENVLLGGYFDGLPIKFNKVFGNFHCENTSKLEGCPREVSGDFSCFGGAYKLTSLEGGPTKVGGNFECSMNKLTSLDGCPKEVGGYFFCSGNEIYDPFPLKNFNWHYPSLSFSDNTFMDIFELFETGELFRNSLDWDYVRQVDGEWCIIKSKLERALKEAGKELPDSVQGYKYI